jgi:DNA polymerase III alpha subunit (gram-positive type)
MIYIVTENQQIIQMVSEDPLKRILPCPVNICINTLKQLDVIGFDIETMGFDPYQDRIICIQLGNHKAQFVIDTGTVDIQLFKSILEEKVLIGHNLKFDIRFLLHNRIVPTQVFDTFIAEKTIHLGIQTHRSSLADCVSRYINIVMDKSERANITGRFTKEFIIYSAIDVAYLHELKQKQEELEEYPISWHFIGTLQKNKINNLIDLNPVLMHSLDSLDLAEELDKKLKTKRYESRSNRISNDFLLLSNPRTSVLL